MSPRPSSSTRCPWPTCGKPIRPAYLMCRTHWYRLPAGLRDRIWATYHRGQTLATASPEYLDALRAALDYAGQASAEEDR